MDKTLTALYNALMTTVDEDGLFITNEPVFNAIHAIITVYLREHPEQGKAYDKVFWNRED